MRLWIGCSGPVLRRNDSPVQEICNVNSPLWVSGSFQNRGSPRGLHETSCLPAPPPHPTQQLGWPASHSPSPRGQRTSTPWSLPGFAQVLQRAGGGGGHPAGGRSYRESLRLPQIPRGGACSVQATWEAGLCLSLRSGGWGSFVPAPTALDSAPPQALGPHPRLLTEQQGPTNGLS